MARALIVKMYDDEWQPVPVKESRTNSHVCIKYRISSTLWKAYLVQTKKFQQLQNRVLEERVKIIQGVTKDAYDDYEED